MKFNDSFCGFCGKNEKDVDVLVKGPIVSVCDECIELLVEMTKEKKQEAPKAEATNPFDAL